MNYIQHMFLFQRLKFININIIYIKYFLFLLQKALFFIFSSLKFMFFPFSLIYSKEKKQKIFYNNLSIHAVIIYFTLCLSIHLIVFMGIVCIIVFMQIVSFKIIVIIISMKRSVFRFVSMPFLIFEKRMTKKIAPGILRFVSMLF